MKKMTLLYFTFVLIYSGCEDGSSVYTPKSDNSVLMHNVNMSEGQLEHYINGLEEVVVPCNWYETEDLSIRQKYSHALLIRQFGDIQTVRTLILFERINIAGGRLATYQEFWAYYGAHRSLWPDKETLDTVEKLKVEHQCNLP